MKRGWIIAGSIAIVVFVLAGAFIFAAGKGLRNFLYPPAPPMPGEVASSMSDVLVQLEKVLQAKAPHVLAQLQPGLSAEEISRLETQNHLQLPDDLKALYQWHNGSRRTTNDVPGDFIPGHFFTPLDEALSERAELNKQANSSGFFGRAAFRVFAGHTLTWIRLFDDGAGDGYYFDPARKAAEGAVFYNFSEDATYTFYPSTKNLVACIAKCYEKDAYRTKQEGSDPPELEADIDEAGKIISKYGVQHVPAEE